MKKLFLQTYGCQMNVRDSEEVAGLLLERGYALTESEQDADVVLYNTCSVREQAENRVWSNVGALKTLKAKRPDLIIGVMGCMAKAQRGLIFKRMPHVDFISGPQQLYEVPDLIENVYERRERTISSDADGGCQRVDSKKNPLMAIQEKRRPEFKTVAYHGEPPAGFVTIMEGCDKVCSYCIIPYTRGPEMSRPPEQIIGEVQEMASQGFREVMLLGQNVNSYGRKKTVLLLRHKTSADPSFFWRREPQDERSSETVTFANLLRQVNDVPGMERIRFITSHPWDAVEELFTAMRDLPRVCEHLHLPVQSGSDPILERMRRGYTAASYLEKLSVLREIVPDVAITTDLIVGFPGETEENFEATVRLVEAAQFDSAFIFKYSPRPFAAATRWPDDIPEGEKDRRLQILLKLQADITHEKDKTWIGRHVELLVEEPGMGRTRQNKKVYFEPGNEKVGELVSVSVEKIRGQSFIGKLEK